ncbi:MAG: hypothetical protein QXP91_02345 [Candidatus Methanomethylicia archaeon]
MDFLAYKRCTPTCSFFRCGRKALLNGRKLRNPKIMCSWAGDECKGSLCNYAFCERRLMLTDGLCGLEERKGEKHIKSLEEEAEELGRSLKSAQEKLKRSGMRELMI